MFLARPLMQLLSFLSFLSFGLKLTKLKKLNSYISGRAKNMYNVTPGILKACTM